eukprot:scaffold398675_cov20-Prasinocladus_malaysianus.AAC.1
MAGDDEAKWAGAMSPSPKEQSSSEGWSPPAGVTAEVDLIFRWVDVSRSILVALYLPHRWGRHQCINLYHRRCVSQVRTALLFDSKGHEQIQPVME